MIDDERIERALRAGPADEPDYHPAIPSVGASRTRHKGRGSLRDLAATIAVAAVVVVSVILLRQGASNDPGSGGHDLLADVRAAGRIRIAVTTGSPQAQVPSVGLDGFDVDVARAIGERLDLPVEIVPADTSSLNGGGPSKPWDLAIASIPATAQRAATLRLGHGYYARDATVVVNTSSSITQVPDLAGRRICVLADSLSGSWLSGTLTLIGGTALAPPATPTVETRPTAAACLDAVRGGIMDAYVADWFVDVEPIGQGLVRLDGSPFTAVAAPGVDLSSVGGESLIDEVDGILSGMAADGSLRTLSERRFGGLDLTQLPTD